MKRPRALESVLLLRLAIVLFISFSAVAAWLWLHLSNLGARYPEPLVHQVMAEFFVHIAWVVPVLLVVTLASTAYTLRRSFAPLRAISTKASEIRPDTLDERLPLVDVPAEVVPLVRATNGMLDRVEVGFAAQRRFTANAAHELRTPLQFLMAELESLGEDSKVQDAYAEVQRMSHLVTQLLMMARLDARRGPLLGRFDLAKVAAETLASLAPHAVARGALVALERQAEPVMVRGDGALASDLLRNLVENALAVSPAGTEVTVVVGADGRLDVVDCGPGIKPEHRERVFERFWRAPDAPAGGSGLGLAIVKEIAHACGARVWISDSPCGGAVVSVKFAGP